MVYVDGMNNNNYVIHYKIAVKLLFQNYVVLIIMLVFGIMYKNNVNLYLVIR
jgi:hypothetical protein